MKIKSLSPLATPKWAPNKHLAGVLGVMAGATVVAVVTVMFGHASRMPWLLPTTDHAALLAPCSRLQGTAARRHCVETVVAAVQARASEVTVATNNAVPLQHTPQ